MKWGVKKRKGFRRLHGNCDCCSGLYRHSSQSAEQLVLWRLLLGLFGPPGLPGLPVSPVSPLPLPLNALCSAGFLLCRAGRCVQLRLTAPPALTVRRLQGASAEPALFNGEGEGLVRGGEGGRKGGERVELGGREVNQCSGRLLGGDGAAPTAGYPPLVPTPCTPHPPPLRGQPLPADRQLGDKGGGEMEVRFGSYCSPPEKAAECVLAAHSCAGPATGENAWLSGCRLCRAKERACIALLGPPFVALRHLFKLYSFTLSYTSFYFPYSVCFFSDPADRPDSS